MAERMGALVTFKAGVTRAEAEKALAGLKGLVDGKLKYPGGDYGKRPVLSDDPATFIETFNDEYGGPVWYIP